ncbi:hypothetical protein LRAMOSA01655 [Lichtheimia ramosa]|uniref:Globin domain-containing protein n=1 Tax=Lichtheimia ramosa TaxID=688394 RepID=A0A077WIT7_9FUNG|nr:hypothetical protein LRAMOSA01655 [Lichtheimia ramosa]
MSTTSVDLLRRKKLSRTMSSPKQPTDEQIELVRSSWERVSELRQESDGAAISPAHAFGLAFYDALFALEPETRLLFKNIFPQARALTGMISCLTRAPAAVTAATTVQQLQQLGSRHAQYNVHPDHLALVGPAFVSALKQRLGEEYTSDIGDAWLSAHAFAAHHMRIGLVTQLAWDGRGSHSNSATCTVQ